MAVNRTISDNPEFASTSRQRIVKALVLAIAALFIFRLGQLQLVKGSDYKSESEAQAIKRVRVEPFRGNMFDRNGILIVNNEPSFSINLTPNDFQVESLPLLASLIESDTSELKRTLNRFKGFSRFTPIKIYRDADFSIISRIEEYNDYLPGIEVFVESKRLYDFEGNMAHLLGYTREISQEQLKRLGFYMPGDVVGQTGLEYSYETLLRGNPGTQYVAVNKFGKKVESFEKGKDDLPASNGFDLTLSIDIRLQELAERLLANRRGSVVAIDPNNGEVLILASKPDYDPRNFSGKVPASIYNQLVKDPGVPLLHRAIQSQYPPGSTWKMLVAIAALQEGLINENSTIPCPGGFTFGGRTWKCHGVHGATSLRRAIQGSCNTYFCALALKLGMSKMEKYGKMFGFGSRTGIDLPNEKAGRMPTSDWLNRIYGPGGASAGRLVNFGIGQGEILVTPLQMAVYTAAIANCGAMHQPHVVRAVHNNVTGKVEPVSYASKNLPVSREIFELMHEGMYDVVNVGGGTALSAMVQGADVCGKTGTAQNPHGQDHAWFVCFAPKKNPKIAMCVFVENAGFGGAVAAPIAKELLQAFFYPDKYQWKKTDSLDVQIAMDN